MQDRTIPLGEERKDSNGTSRWNETAAEYPREATISELFELQLEQFAGFPAVLDRGSSYTYAELNERALVLEKQLRKMGPQSEQLVGILLDRSFDFTACLLAVLKTGGAYLPLDADLPDERIRFLLQDSGTSVVMTTRERSHKLASFDGNTVYIDDPEPDREPAAVLAEQAAFLGASLPSSAGNKKRSSTSLAYVMYTSGSTGQPKGVMVEQRGIVRLVKNTNYITFHPGTDRILQTGALGFDASTFEIWGALLNGAALVIEPKHDLLDAERLESLLAQHAITILWLTAPLFHQLALEKPGMFAPLQQLIVGGDVLQPKIVSCVRKQCPQVKLINGYGPTENTTFSTYHVVDRDDDSTIPIGLPISNSTAYIVDEKGIVVPDGDTGELWVGGDGVARGYLHRQELTAEKFIASPFRQGERLYRTGDLARRRSDGTIEFLGRKDSQVKIRGYRIEIGEIEQILFRLDGIKEGAVVLRGQGPDKQLCAYYSSEPELAAETVKFGLSRVLPDYMVPDLYVRMDKLPLNANGKIDRAKLPEPVRSVSTAPQPGREQGPGTKVEAALLELWRSALQNETIGTKDHFFACGGHSMKAMALIALIKKTFSVPFSIKALYAHPTVEAAASLLEQQLAQASAAVPPLRHSGSKGWHSLSSAQTRMFMEQHLEPSSTAYNIPMIWHIEGPLEVERLRAALQKLVRRHASLRTFFVLQDGQPMQQVLEQVEVELVCSDMSARERGQAPDNQPRIHSFIRPFDLAKAPLLRAAVVRAGTSAWLLLDVHHIVCDGTSLSVLLRDLSLFYNNERLPAPQFTLTDYAEWERLYLASPEGRKHENYWKELYLEPIVPIRLPYDAPITSARPGKAGHYSFSLDAARSARLQQWADQHSSTVFTALFALYNLLWYRYSGQTDLVIGTVTASRQHVELQSTVGMFVSTLAVRCRMEAGIKLGDWVRQTHHQLIDAYEHELFPLEKLVRYVQRHRDTNRNPLFNTAFVWQNAGPLSLTLPQMAVSAIPVPQQDAKFDLLLEGKETDGELHLRFEYRQDRFRPETIESLASDFLDLAEWALASEPDTRVDSFELPRLSGRSDMLRRLNRTATVYPRDRRVNELFEEQAALFPEHTAVICGTESISYQQLSRRSQAIAMKLRDRGVGKDKAIGILLPRSIDYIAAVLAALKAGGAYLPLDPELPDERIRYMLENSGAEIVLTHSSLQNRLAHSSMHSKTMLLEDESTVSANEAESAPLLEEAGDPTDLAYVLYTSGSTGLPKGVMIEHRSVVRLVRGANYVTFIPGQDKVLQAGALGFDATTFEIWGALLNGGTLVLANKYDLLSAASLKRLLDRHSVTILLLTSPLFHQLAIEQADLFASLRYLLVGGDVIFPKIAGDVVTCCPGVQLINVYGPTENATFSTTFPIDKPFEQSIPIGHPISNSTAYIVGNDGQLLDVGEAGELWVGGDGVARGYINNPELTADKFIPSPFRQGERLYKTGDMARLLEDGTIEFLGRKDSQVKIRGYRIELSEIERALLRHEAVREAVVRVKEGGYAKFICAYFTASAEVTAEEARAHLSAFLPEYMLPRAYIQLKQMPLKINGKIDSAALPEPETGDIEKQQVQWQDGAPESETEKQLLKLWQEVLQYRGAGIDDHFFEMGGHSLSAMKLIAAANESFRTDVPIRALFEQPTVRHLAAVIETASTKASALPEVEQAASYPLAYSQRHMYIEHQQHPDGCIYNMPMLWRFESGPPLSLSKLETAAQELVRRHEAFRTSFHLQDGEPVQRVHPNVDLHIDEERLRGFDQLPQVVHSFLQPFELEKAPLLRMKMICAEDSDRAAHYLLLDMHHIISDGVSVERFMDELVVLYEGGTPVWPITQMKDYAVWQMNALKTPEFHKQEAYWQAQYKEEVQPLQLPFDKPRRGKPTGRGARVSLQADPETALKLQQFSKAHQVTLYMALFSMYSVWLSKYAGQTDLVIGTPVSGRWHTDFQGTIGMFVNTLAIRSFPLPMMSFLQFLGETKENVLLALEHQAYPLELLVKHAAVSRRQPNRNPLFDTMFVMQSVNDRQRANLFQPEQLDVHRAKFDLLLESVESGGSLTFHLEYDTDLIEYGTAARMAAHFLHVVRTVLADPQICLAEVELVTAEEKAAMINDHPAEPSYYNGQTVIELVEESCCKFGGKHAVVDAGRGLSYNDLRIQSNRVAHALRSKGIRGGDVVALSVERSIEAIIAMVGIFKSGAVYLPIDCTTPPQRMELILAEANAVAAILSTDLRASVPFQGQPLDMAELLREPDASDVPCTRQSGDLAYLIFTSGSTGTPKGVMIGERSFANAVEWHRRFYGIVEDDRSTQYASLGFDASILEIFPYLIAGATLHIVPERIKLDMIRLNDYYEQIGITVSFLPTQIAESFMHLPNRSLRLLLTAGDKLRSFTPQRYSVYNNYGPTENTVVATCHLVQENGPNIPIGKPVSNARIYILDPYGRLLPAGMSGELCIAGEGLALGYWKRPELTEQQFVSHPLVPAGKLYRTGDLARWRADGTLEYIGRLDNQVKIRGNRVELGEVERVVIEHPATSAAVVLDIEDQLHDKSLCAFYVAARELPREQWLAYCSARLPGYMVPSMFVKLEAIPLNTNGKIDRKRLLELAEEARRNLPSIGTVAEEQPSDRTEVRIAEAFYDVLGLRLGLHDHFFEHGGDSIKAIRVVSQLSEHYELGINHLFEHPTIAQLKAAIRLRSESVRMDGTKSSKEHIRISDMKRELRAYQRRIFSNKLLVNEVEDRFRQILLTGSTGYFGMHVLHALLEATDSRVHLLVRAESDDEAVTKVAEMWRFYFGVPFSPEGDRVRVYAGDITEERLGLCEDMYRQLAAHVDCIIHAAAKTQHYGFLEDFERINVKGTEEVLRLSVAGRSKHVYYISTLSVASGLMPGRSFSLFTEYDVDAGQISDNYYIRTKLEAEKRIQRHSEQGHSATILRLGNVLFHSVTGKFQKNIADNAFYGLFRALYRFKIMPDLRGRTLDFSYVDCAGDAVAKLVASRITDAVIHVANPRRISYRLLANLINQACREPRIQLHRLPEFLRITAAAYRDQPQLSSEAREDMEKINLEFHADQLAAATPIFLRSNKSEALLSQLNVHWPAVELAQIARMLAYCREVGFIHEQELISRKGADLF